MIPIIVTPEEHQSLELGDWRHNEYPHFPGTLYGCMACEMECFCGPESNEDCVYCALSQESEDLASYYDRAAWYAQDS